jgi:hypothetical protein
MCVDDLNYFYVEFFLQMLEAKYTFSHINSYQRLRYLESNAKQGIYQQKWLSENVLHFIEKGGIEKFLEFQSTCFHMS